MRKSDLLVPVILLLVSCQTQNIGSETVPDLNASAADPLFATYAAARERSNFILDEGYEFVFYRDESAPVFTSDTGGEIGFSFKKGQRWVYKTGDYFRKPVIHSSFPDAVNFSFSPFDGLDVKSKFLVYSSNSSVLEFTFTNGSDSVVQFDFIPFIQAGSRLFRAPEADNREAHFCHEEYPDTWTQGSGLPYADSLQNFFALSAKTDKTSTFSSLTGEAVSPPWQVFPTKSPRKEVNGRIYDAGGQRVMKQAPVVRLQAYLDNDTRQLLTESSPVFGSLQGALNSDGFFRLELANLKGLEKSVSFTLTAVDDEVSLMARSVGVFPNDKKQFRSDLSLQKLVLPQPPAVFSVKMQGERRAALTWSRSPDGSRVVIYRKKEGDAYFSRFTDPLETTNLMVQLPTDDVYSFVAVGQDTEGTIGIQTTEVSTLGKTSMQDALSASAWQVSRDWYFKVLAHSKSINLKPGESHSLRLVRSVAEAGKEEKWLEAKKLLQNDFSLEVSDRREYLNSIPALEGLTADENLLYLSGWNMMQQVFYPAEGKSSYPYYVFSREPVWGWGHGGQVFHESLTMLALALQDPELAMNSQRVFMERQYESGYINYRTGSYLDEIIEYEGELTSSAPWYAWINWEVYKITQDKVFLEEVYESSKKFYEFYIGNRDKDGDGLCEWGGHAVLESVRDASVAVWDEVGWPANFEAVDLNAMLVMEAKSLEQMALTLGETEDAVHWKADYDKRTMLINATFWDEETGFYYNADKKDNDFTFEKPDDLKRMEIIGFLPLWAGIANEQQAARLVTHLTNPNKFWRPYGVPSLAADDPFYNDKGYWNGPVWVEWDYLIQRGLQQYGYEAEAKELVSRVAKGMAQQLKVNHNLWEFYSPDTAWAGYHRTYIWAGIVNRMLWDVRKE